MTEIPGPKPAEDVHWADGLITGGVVEPSEARKSNGYDNLTFPVHSEMNWIFRYLADQLQWAVGDNDPTTPLQGAIIRRFAQLTDAIAATKQNEPFWVEAGFPDQFASANNLSELTANTTNPTSLATDGEYVIVSSGSAVTVYAASDLSTPIWGPTSLGATVNDVDIDGEYAWAVTNAQAGAEVYRLNRETGATIETIEVGLNVIAIASNGQFVTYIAANNTIYLESIPFSGTPDTFTHNDVVYDCAIDGQQIYLAAETDNGGAAEVLRAFQITSPSGIALVQNWFVAGTGSQDFKRVITDGFQVYAAGDFTGTINLAAFRADSGALQWSATVAFDPVALAVDHTRLYVAHNNGAGLARVVQYNKRTGVASVPYFNVSSSLTFVSAVTDTITALAADGMTFFASTNVVDPTSDQTLFRRDIKRGHQMYKRALGNDPNRVPFHNLAIPLASTRDY